MSTTAAGTRIEICEGTLRAAVAQRSSTVASALDEGQSSAWARAWAARAMPDSVVEAVRVRSVLYRPDGSWTLRYQVQLSPGRQERMLLVEVPPSTSDVMIRPFPDDPGLPTLPRALDPDLMREVLGRAVPGTGGARAIGRCGVDVVRYPRQGRCVLRYRLSVGAGGLGELRHPVVFGKVYSDDDTAATTAAALRLLRRELANLPDHPRIVVPQPLGVVPSLRLGLVEAVAGRPLLPDLLKAACAPDASASDMLSSAVRTAARTAAAIHACSASGVALPVRDLSGEVAATERDIRLLQPMWPEVATRLRPAVTWALEATDHHQRQGAPGGWPLAPVPAHGDFTPSQVLLDGPGRTGIVDVDTLCIAEPALDIGRFLAYLHVTGIRRSRGAWPVLEDMTALFLESYLEARPASRDASASAAGARRLFLERTAAFHALALGRIGASACRQLKDARLAAVVDVLDTGSGWMRGVAV
jgi:aminoglycoside phosphotransferase (APT) family kinase protein